MSDAPPITDESTPKRGRGRPSGSYGKYRPRLPPELKEPDELNPLAQKLNEAINSEINSAEGQKRRRSGPLDNQKRELFARNVAKGMPTNQAYVAAGYCAASADAAAYVMVKHPEVAARIDELKAAAAKAALITPARVLEATGELAFAKVVADPNDLSEITREQIGALSIKKGALDSLGKYLGMSKEKVEHSGPGGGPIAIDILHNLLLQPAVLDRLSDVQVEALRSAIPLLALPAPTQVIDAVAVPIAEVAAGVHSECSADAAGELSEVEPAEEPHEG
jgi:phage terminase small subunit